jgi:hypothetical protein
MQADVILLRSECISHLKVTALLKISRLKISGAIKNLALKENCKDVNLAA